MIFWVVNRLQCRRLCLFQNTNMSDGLFIPVLPDDLPKADPGNSNSIMTQQDQKTAVEMLELLQALLNDIKKE